MAAKKKSWRSRLKSVVSDARARVAKFRKSRKAKAAAKPKGKKSRFSLEKLSETVITALRRKRPSKKKARKKK